MLQQVGDDVLCLILSKWFDEKLTLVSRAWYRTIVTNPDTFPRHVYLWGKAMFPSGIGWCRRVRCIEVRNVDLFLITGKRQPVDVTDHILFSVALGCPRLTHLNVMNCPGITDASIETVVRSCPQLAWLNVQWCRQLTDGAIKTVAEGCPQLTHLDIGLCSWLTDASIEAVAKGCPLLTHLNMGGCQLTDASIKAVAKGCPRLTHLTS